MNTTHHARVRAQQRAIPPIVVDLLDQFGAREPAGDGAWKLFFDKQSRRRFRAYAGPLASSLEQHLDVYAVVDGRGKVITLAHRLDRISRH
jgi:hypothetical protein